MTRSLDDVTRDVINSGVLAESDLRACLDAIPATNRPQDGEALARELVKQKLLTKFQAEQVYAGKGKSLTLGNYVILDKLGQGGMGMVLKAKHKRMGRVVALKVMSPAAVKSPDAVKRFHREVQTAAKLTHPNIVTAFDADEAKGTHFLVMEYVEGDDLSQLVKKYGPMSVEQAMECILQAARGLAHAHKEGVIHRDIKPANLLLDKNGTVKILDMGLARLESGLSDAGGVAGAGLTQSGTIMGTVDYMSPEQAEDTRHADARADIYSLGCSLYYLLIGRAVYDGETLMKKLLAHREAAIPSLVDVSGRALAAGFSHANTDPATSVASAIPLKALDAVFHKMVAKRPSDRYQSMGEVIADLERCRSGEGVTVNVAAVSGESGSSFELQNFLRQISGDAGSQVTSAATGQLGTGVLPISGTAETMLLTSNSAGTDPQTEMTLAGERSRSIGKMWQSRNGLLAIVGVVILLLGSVWLFRAPRGELRIEITDEQIEVILGETGRSLRGTKSETVKLPVGEHVLHVKLGETTLDTPEITVAKGKPVEIKVEKVGSRVRVMRGKEFLVAKELSRRTTGGSKDGNADPIAEVVPQFALEFDGQASYVGLPNVGLSSVKPFTAEAWVRLSKLTEPTDSAIVVGSGLLLSRMAKGTWSFHINGMKGDFSSDTEAVVGEWVHLAAVWDGSSRSLYVDGRCQQATEKKGSGKKAVDSPPRETITEISLGGITRVGKSAGTRFLAGQMREVRISNVARYQSDFQPAQRFAPDKNTLGLYHFDEGTGETLKDSSSNNHHGKIVAAKWVKLGDGSATPRSATSVAANKFALQFDGDDNVAFGRELDLPPDSCTIEAFVRIEAFTPRAYIFSPGGTAGLSFDFQDGSDLRMGQVFQSGGHHSTGKNSTKPELGRRYHVAGVSDSSGTRVYLDGRQTATSPPLNGRALERPRGLCRAGFQFTGIIDGIKVSKKPLYTIGFTPPERFTPDANTVALYRFDEGRGDELKDSSGNNHHGQIVGAKWVQATQLVSSAPPQNYALEFDGIDDLVLLSTLTRRFDGPYTVEARVKIRNRQNEQVFVCGPTSDLAWLPTGSGLWKAAHVVPGEQRILCQVADPADEVHVAAVFDGKSPFIYVNGKRAGAGTRGVVSALTQEFNWTLGAIQTPGVASTRHFAGELDELRVSTIARYPAEFAPPSRAARFTPDKDTLALYHFDEGSGDVLKDSSGNNHHGRIVGPKWVSAGNRSAPTSPPPMDRQALSFDGMDDYVDLPTFPPMESFTVEAICTPHRYAHAQVVSSKGFYLSMHNDQPAWSLVGRVANDQFVNITSPQKIASRQRVTLAGVYDGKKLRLFVDGKLIGENPSDRPGSVFRIGSLTGTPNNFFPGTMEAVRFSRGARYDSDYSLNEPWQPDESTVALYRCDEGSGDALKDSSGNNRHGKITGAKWVRLGNLSTADTKPADYILAFDGKGRVDVSGVPLDVTKPLTIEAFVKPEASATTGHVLSTGPPEFGLRFTTKRQWEFFWLSVLKAQSDPMPLDRRTHVAAVLDRGQVRLCVDGKIVHSRPIDSANLKRIETSIVQLGREFAGQHDEIRISRVARYSEEFTPEQRFTTDANTIALFHCDEGNSDQLFDSSGNNHHGKIVGAKWARAGTPP